MRKTIQILLAVCLMYAGNVAAQDGTNMFGVGVSAATNGFGANAYWQPTSKWKVALAGEFFPSLAIEEKITEGSVSVDMDAKVKTGGVFLTGGYQFLSWMYATAGVGINFFKASALGTPLQMKYGDIYLEPETIGSLDVNIKSGSAVSPYLAIGFGRQAPTERIAAVGVELGAYYMGSPKLELDATGMLAPTGDAAHVKKLQNELSAFSFYPMIKLNVTFNLLGH